MAASKRQSVRPGRGKQSREVDLHGTSEEKEFDSRAENVDNSLKKRKHVSEAERLALELSKLTPKHAQQSKLKFDDGSITFVNSTCPRFAPACTWHNNKRDAPCYCPRAEFRFEASMPDRSYLTRYSVACSHCYDETTSAHHLYCSYCDEVLTGSIAGPGGKITDHVITIRHIHREATALGAYLARRGFARRSEMERAREYAERLGRWAEEIRFPKGSLRRADFEDVLTELKERIDAAASEFPPAPIGAVAPPPPRRPRRAPPGALRRVRVTTT